MSIRTKIIISLSILALVTFTICALLAYIGYVSKRNMLHSLKLQEDVFVFSEFISTLKEVERRLYVFGILPTKAEEKYISRCILELTDCVKDVRLRNLSAEIDVLKASVEGLFLASISVRHKLIDEVAAKLQKLIEDVARKKQKSEDMLTQSKIYITKLASASFLASISVAAAFFIINIAIVILLYISVAKPIMVLQNAASIIGSGNLNYRVNLKTKDEFNTLANAFNEMVENIKNLQVQIVAMDRMSSIGQLAGGIAHEINNPLTGVIGQAQILLAKMPKDSQFYESVRKIEQAAQRCRRIVKALLDFARSSGYSFIKTDINKLLDDTFELCISDLMANKISLVKEYSQLPAVSVSPSHIQQVFINIITNAMQAMPNGGVLTVKTLREDKCIKISFKDTGVGIKQHDLQKLFTPFFTTKDVGQGVGLGLAVSYGIIQKHNGEIYALSDGEGKGAEFVIKLPL